MSLLDKVKERFQRPPEPVRVAVLASSDLDERVLAWGPLDGVSGVGWLVVALGLAADVASYGARSAKARYRSAY